MIFRHPTNSMPGRVVRDEVIHLMKTPLIDQTALKSAAVKTQPITGQAEIEFVLTTEGQGQFAKLTCENINSRVAVIVDGNVMFVPVIISEVTNGLVEIYGNFNELEATNLVMRVNGATSR